VDYLNFVIPGIVALVTLSASFNGVASKLQVDRFFYKSFDETIDVALLVLLPSLSVKHGRCYTRF
jgi:hypothetical protein